MDQLSISLNSEVGRLRGVLLHRPGSEIEQMTPSTVKQALYSDLLSQEVAGKEYAQLEGVLSRYACVFYIDSLIQECLQMDSAKQYLLGCLHLAGVSEGFIERLSALEVNQLAKLLVEGSGDGIWKPLYNLYFMRDLGVCFNQHSMPMQMSTRTRAGEILLTDMIYQFHPLFSQGKAYVNPWKDATASAHMEGGDFLVAGKNLFLIGQGCRSNRQGVEAFIREKSKETSLFYVITQDLPREPESFIHLDMVFTLLSREDCMVYAPLILGSNEYKTRLLTVENGNISETVENNILVALQKLGYKYNAILCGGNKPLYQDREQWHSGANFFAIAPGKIMGYGRNIYTIESLSKAGYEVVTAYDILADKTGIEMENMGKKTVISLESAELVRGGGGCRCMTMPIGRENM